jgi:ketosteroid isomerase-like protein
MKMRLIGVALTVILVAGWGDDGEQINAEAIVNEFIAATEALDLERTLSLYGDNIIWEDPGYGEDGDYFTSKGEVEAMWRWLYSLPDVQIDDTDYLVSADDHRAVVEWVWSGTNDDETYAIRGVSVLEIQDGKIVHEVIYYDPTTAP